MQDLPDGELMDRYAHGSQPAFDELFRRYEGRAFRFFLRRVSSEERAQDLYQELFLRLHRFRATFDPARPFQPWFFRIMRTVLVDEWRRQHGRTEVTLTEDDLRSEELDAEHAAEIREGISVVLGLLTNEQARILIDAKVRGLEHAEIAASLSKSTDAVKQIASRTLRRLRAAPAFR